MAFLAICETESAPCLMLMDEIENGININYAENREILENCRDLKCYSIFIARVREALAQGRTLRQAIIASVRYCKENDLLKEYFAQKEQEEVLDMVNFKWDPELAMQARLDDAREEGMEKGMMKHLIHQVYQKMLRGQEPVQIAEALEEEETVIQEIYDIIDHSLPEFDMEKVYLEMKREKATV